STAFCAEIVESADAYIFAGPIFNDYSSVTAQDVSTMLRCGQNPIIFLINNGGYTIEVEIHDGPYNVIKNWNYTGLVDAIHNGEGKCWTTKVKCEEELIEAIETATGAKKDCLCFIEVIAHKDDTSKELLEWGSRATLGRHLAQCLVHIGVSDVFSVPGDFNLSLLDYLIAEPGLNLIGHCNADGYASNIVCSRRIRSVCSVQSSFIRLTSTTSHNLTHNSQLWKPLSAVPGSLANTTTSLLATDDATLWRHLAQRLVQIGVSDVFSVPGDFNLSLLDYLIAEPGLNLIGYCNADGYARYCGVVACVVTFNLIDFNYN
nr:pyruvate decarboxylase 2 [Tanacetum cinerariifolium]